MKALFCLAVLMLSGAVFAQESVSGGLILPARLDSTVSSKSKTGEVISATIMQDVPLPGGDKIRTGSRIWGHVISAQPNSTAGGWNIVFAFEKLTVQHHTLNIETDLRAMASPMEVDEAQVPAMGPDRGTPPVAYTTVQVGGDDVVYRGGGYVQNASEIVGEPAPDGILGRALPGVSGDCRGTVEGYDQAQAFWVFSTDACGLYGFAGVNIVRTGKTDPLGQIELSSTRNLRIWSGSGLLLRVIHSSVSTN